MSVLITKMHRTNRIWFEDLHPAHTLLYAPINELLLHAHFGRQALPEAAKHVVKNPTRYAVSKANRVTYVPVEVALAMSSTTLNNIVQGLDECLQDFKDEGVEALIIGFNGD